MELDDWYEAQEVLEEMRQGMDRAEWDPSFTGEEDGEGK